MQQRIYRKRQGGEKAQKRFILLAIASRAIFNWVIQTICRGARLCAPTDVTHAIENCYEIN
ncbi:hypothetical protein [Chroococcidiopsis sp [FACHB-1243]]|uniref:hypothetical protein n=1 Tax=Chroococcidiopsis sp. [FACHB-1243] TaxID=2692781 RepID=UPI001A7F0500|nr:hypothetical protein [Chroococcidiopsis sp. [FACHB-1243]]